MFTNRKLKTNVGRAESNFKIWVIVFPTHFFIPNWISQPFYALLRKSHYKRQSQVCYLSKGKVLGTKFS